VFPYWVKVCQQLAHVGVTMMDDHKTFASTEGLILSPCQTSGKQTRWSNKRRGCWHLGHLPFLGFAGPYALF
jgi:hypothetical protein